MKTDYIDLYQMHHVARDITWDEVWEAFDVLVKQGKVIYAGSSNFGGWHIAQANEAASRRNYLGLVSEQSKYSLACRHVELEVLPASLHYGLGVIPWSPLDGGFLGGVLENTEKGRRSSEAMIRRIDKERDRLTRWEDWCRTIGQSPANVALAWTLHHPAVTAPIIGPRTIQQLIDCATCVDLKFTDDQLKEIDKIWPGPKGPTETGISDFKQQAAPEAYAW